jgi:hypothetical protein
MARTFTPITGSGSGGSIIASDKWGVVKSESVRQALDMALYLAGHLDLGGDERGILSASFVAVNGPRSFSIQGDCTGGLTLDAVVYYYTSDASTTVQVRVRNTTDSTTAASGAVSASTAVVSETLTVTLASGTKSYQLQVTGSDAVNPVYAWGYLRLRKIPA